jgi:hypothetical protein
MEPLDLAMVIFLGGVVIVTAIGYYKSYKNKED